MSWQHFMTRISGQRAQVLLDRQFEGKPLPGAQLPHFATVTIKNQLPPSGALWHPDEAPRLEKMEASLLQEVGKASRGWGIYVCRIAVEGSRQYFIYFGDQAQVAKGLVTFQDLNPTYKAQVDFSEDPSWSHYQGWLKQAPPPQPR